MSQEELSGILGVTRTYLSMIENDKKKASLSFLRDVASFFHIPIALLLGWEGNSRVDDVLSQEIKKLFTDLLRVRLALMPQEK